MNRILKRTIVSLLAAVAIGAGASPAKAGFVNGSFETGNLTGWGGTATTDGYGYNPFGTTFGSGMDGAHWMWLAGYEINRTLNQTLTGLTAGNTYNLDFIMASEYVNSDSLHVSVDGGPQTLFTAPGINSTFWDNWVSQTFTFTATGTTAFVEFSTVGLNAGGYDVGIDNIRLREDLNPVPAPPAAGLFAVGLVGLAGFGAMRRRTQAVAVT